MKPQPFVHHAVGTVEQAVAALARLAPEGGRILAGGQSLVPMMAYRLAAPAHLIDINRIPGIDQPIVRDDSLIIPAACRHATLHRMNAAGPLGALLARVAGHIAHHPIRTRGTFCGSLANADPSAEWGVVLMAVGGVAVARSEDGVREIPAAVFFRGVMTTALQACEMLTEVRLPLLAPDARTGFCEHSRRAGDYAQAMTLVTWRLREGAITQARVAVGGVEPCPRRLPEVEGILENARPSLELYRRATEAAAGAVVPMEDGQTSAGLRRDLLRGVTRRALEQAAA